MPTDIEQRYVDQGYTLPEGYTWKRVHEERRTYRVAPHLVPVEIRFGGDFVVWGVPAPAPAPATT